ncbi:hypothetical protein K443DRAFT_15950 [Laccaria amethystina LaAM-08-1]|uniref:Uncharacterized protein n=1 Tax=Laccaria amethystina LaAM-08-1 TaxID=1095629 RepID=A0A0C9WKN3_9AGAR|nr:hypothetical protein K443DRAFT_15950 [Laccaria amethystina LaAM-08-1]
MSLGSCEEGGETRGKGEDCVDVFYVGRMSLLSWASYSPPKHALRGLADILQSEPMLYGILLTRQRWHYTGLSRSVTQRACQRSKMRTSTPVERDSL